MSSRRWGVGVAIVVAAVLAVTLAGWALLQPQTGSNVEHRYSAGGFTLALPSSWHIHTSDSAARPWSWIEAERPSRLGPSDAWLWVNRTEPRGRNHLDTIRRAAVDDIHRLWGDVHIRTAHITFAGHDALRLTYSHPYIRQLASIPGSDVDEVRLITEAGGEVYELGVAGWRDLPVDADELDHLLRLTRPWGMRTIGDETVGARVSVPAAWNRQIPDPSMTDAVLTANDPSQPARAWTILWRLDADLETAVANSADKAAREGTITRRSDTFVAGRRATRIDFTRAAPGAELTYSSTWIFTGPDGRTWQLLVGGTTDVTRTATQIATSLQFLAT